MSPEELAAANVSRRNLAAPDLVKEALRRGEVKQAKSGSVVVYTGKYTGRSPKDKFIVDSPSVHDKVNWGAVNAPISGEKFDALLKKITAYLAGRESFVFEGIAGVESMEALPVRVIAERAYEALFATYMFAPSDKPAGGFKAGLTVIAAPGCHADPATDGVNSETFIVLNLEKRMILIGGTEYCGEIKKSVFSFLNFMLPEKGVFPMHSSANVGHDGSSAIFFGLSGTGKTTLSADPDRMLIGDDEHGWSEDGVFNFENGCYAKCINLRQESEPQIWQAIKDGALLENVALTPDGEFNFDDASYTENTRAAYPLKQIPNAVISRKGPHPKTVIFLTADAFGVLPPVARLDSNAAMYHFLSGYTSKLAGTERGITEPKTAFSECFGAPFMPRRPIEYAELLKRYTEKHGSEIYLINTGWSGGPYGVGRRISIKDTRAIVSAALQGLLKDQEYRHDGLFNLDVPTAVPGVDSAILDPRGLWADKAAYDIKAKELAQKFAENFKKFEGVPKEIEEAGPKI